LIWSVGGEKSLDGSEPPQLVLISMPKIPIDKHGELVFGDRQIGLAKHVLGLEAIANAHSMQMFSQDHLRFGVGVFHPGHHARGDGGISGHGRCQMPA
jgi:hypothetical protein